MLLKVHIDGDSCSGTGTCVRLAPGLLHMVKDGTESYAEVLPDGQATEDEMWEAAKACPWAAVVLESDDGRVLFP